MKNKESRRKKKSRKIPVIAGILLMAAVCGFSTARVLAKVNPTAQTKVEKTNSDYLIGTAKESEIGRYQLKMAGNISYYTTWNPTWTDIGGLLDTLKDDAPSRDEILKYYSYPTGGNKDVIYQNKLAIKKYPYGNGAKQTYTTISYSKSGVKKKETTFDPSKIKANSSVANLDLSGGFAYKAYLLWYVRDDNQEFGFANKSVDLYYEGKNKKSITAEKAHIDVRESTMVTAFDESGKEVRTTQNINSYLCMAADVTSYVKEHGSGTYGVANLPYWYQTKDNPNGGASIGSWQLVVVAEKEDWDVKAVAVKMGSTFMGTTSTGAYSETIKSSLRSKTNALGQIFVSGLYGNNGVSTTVQVIADKIADNGNKEEKVVSSYLPAGMINGNYPEGSSDAAKSNFFSAVTGIGTKRHNKKYTLNVTKTTSWDTYFCLGMSVDVDIPMFEKKQQTTYNAADKTVTVTGKRTNITENSEPKMYDGRLVVKLDSNLTNATNIAFSVKNQSGTVIQSGTGTYNASDNTVTFTGINSSAKGDVIDYSITCSLKNDGVLEVNNSDEFFGKVQYGTEKTGIEVPFEEANSRADISVHVTLDSQGAKIDGGKVTSEGTKEYYIRYGSGSYADSNLTTQINTITTPTKKHCTFMGYYTAENGGGTQCIDKNGTILNTGKSFTRDTTLYAYWSPAVFTITLNAQRSEGALTNASSRTKAIYSKYYTGLFADAACTRSISSAVMPTSNGETCIGYWSVPGGSTMGANAAQYIESNGNLLQGAGTFDCKLITKNMTIYADWQSKNYTINCNVNTLEGIFDYGTRVFYEEYGKKFTFTQKNTDVNNMQSQTFSFTGSVQEFTAPYTGWYYFEVWGAQGGSGFGIAGGKGGYSSGWKRLAQGAKVYVVVGGQGGNTTKTKTASSATGGTNDTGVWFGSGGYNGGQDGRGYADWWGVGAGGGSTDIRIGGKKAEHRVIAGGGGGGGAKVAKKKVKGKTGDKTHIGGGGGGTKYWLFPTNSDGLFTGDVKEKTTSDTEESPKNALTGKYYGDGGGYKGGKSADSGGISSGQGGANYNTGVDGIPSAYASLDSCKTFGKTQSAKQQEGNGKAVIHYFGYNETPGTQTTSIYIPERNDGTVFAGYFTQPNGGEQVVAPDGRIVVSNTYFNDSNTVNGQATIYAHWGASSGYTIVYHANGGSGTVASQICERDKAYALNANTFAPPYGQQSKAICWNTMPDGSGISYSAGQSVTNLANPGETIVLYAQWQQGTASYTVKHWKQKVNGTAGVYDDNNYELAETETFSAQVGSIVSPAVKSYTGFKSPAVQQGTVKEDGSLIIQYYYDRQSYLVTLYAGTGIESTSGGGSYLYGNTVNISAVLKEGYHWKDWTGTYQTDQQSYSFTMPAQNVTMTANGEANTYTIRFDPNGGTGHIDDIVTTYDTEVTLPDATGIYKKYTLDGVNVTADVVSGAIPEDVIVQSDAPDEEDPDEKNLDREKQETGDAEKEELQFEEPETEVTDPDMEETELPEDDENNEADLDSEEEQKAAQSLKKAYRSVFLGWALYDDKDKLIPTWKAGEVVKNLTAEDGGEITLYAVWDDCPWISATDLYYTLGQAQSGYITETEILSHATAEDREDGSPILPGINPAINNPDVNTSFTIPDYQESEFTGMTHDAAVTENLTVMDSVGNTYWKQITVYVVDTSPQKVTPVGTTRFISEKYFNTDHDHGGLEDNSIWKTDPEYQAALQKAFDNLKNNTPDMTFYITHETVLEMKQFVQEHGVGKTRESGALQQFYNELMAPNRT